MFQSIAENILQQEKEAQFKSGSLSQQGGTEELGAGGVKIKKEQQPEQKPAKRCC